MIDLLVSGGRVVHPWGIERLDIAIDGGRIAALGKGAALAQARRTLEADGCYVLPGLVDAHTHFEAPARGARGGDDFATGSVSAAFGGITTIIDFIIPGYHDSVWRTFQERRELAAKSKVDYAFHAAFVAAGEERLAEIPWLVDAGIVSLKAFMISVNDGPFFDYYSLSRLIERAQRHGAIVAVHAEDPAFERLEWAGGPEPWRRHAEIKGARCEEMAVLQAIACAENHGAPVYFVHTTSAAALVRIEEARRRGVRVFAETCPHYLLFNDGVYDDPKGYRYLMSPPIKGEEDRRALWKGLGDNLLQVISSDHCPYTEEEKKRTLANGVAGIEVMLPLLYTHGMAGGGLGIRDIVRLTSYNPARIFGLYPRKGIIAPGSDADLVLYDPEGQRTLHHADLHMNTGYSLYEGFQVTGRIAAVLRRGEILVRDGSYVGEEPGAFVPGEFAPELHPRHLGAF